MLIDAHTHLFSRPFFEAMAAASPLPGTVAERLEGVVTQTGLELPAADLDQHTARWLAELDAHGVDHCVTFASLPQEAEAVAAVVARAPERFSGYALVNPLAAAAAETTETHFSEQGFKGILLFPAMHGFHPADAACQAVVEVVARHRGIAMIHCGILQVKLRDLLGLPRPFDLAYANPLGLVPLANRFREARFVVPHFGAGFFREVLMLGVQCKNVLVDTSSSNSWMATQPGHLDLADVFRQALEVFGAERLLFGTDSSTFPRGWRGDLLASQRGALEAAGADDEVLALILGGNIRALLDRVGASP